MGNGAVIAAGAPWSATMIAGLFATFLSFTFLDERGAPRA